MHGQWFRVGVHKGKRFSKIFEVILPLHFVLIRLLHDSIDAPAVQMPTGARYTKQILLHSQIIYEKHSPPTGKLPPYPSCDEAALWWLSKRGYYDKRFVPCLHISKTERGREGGNETNYAKACAVTAIIVEHIKMRVRNTYSTYFFLKGQCDKGEKPSDGPHIW